MPPDAPLTVTLDDLLARHAVLLLDAYGVLLHHAGPLPNSPELVERLNRSGKPYYILTNDASRLPSTSAARFAAMGLAIPEQRVITSGCLLAGHFAHHGLAGQRCLVLGPEDSRAYVRQAGGQVVEPGDDAAVLVICDEVGFAFVETVDATLTLLFRRLDAGQPVHLLCPNPDLVYPKTEHGFGITAGSIANLFETALRQRYPDRDDLRFARLGKPERPIFDEALRRAGTRDAVMVGDQLGTDIKGALDAGLPAALVATGLDRYRPEGPVQPTYLLPSLALG